MHLLVLLTFGNLFSTDMVVIGIIALVLFGGDKLPEIARALGKGIRDFKDASEGVKREINAQIYSYEEKKAEETAAAKYQAEQNNPPSAETRPPVANTVPVNESVLNGSSETLEHTGAQNTELADNDHPAASFENKDRPVV